MMRDITLGQYFPGNSVIHKMDARMKIILLVFLIVDIFLASTPAAYLIAAIVVFLAVILSKIPFSMILKSLKPLLYVVILTTIINLLFTNGEVLWQFWIIKITKEGIIRSAEMIVRIFLLVIATSLLTYTTSPMTLTDALERLLSPLKKIKLPVHEFAMMMTIALRFIPTLIEEVDKITAAQKARGADFESGNLFSRVKALVPILIPLFVSAFRRADELAVAMESRCYKGDEGRTRLREYKLAGRDWVSFGILVLTTALIIGANILWKMYMV